MKQLLFIFIGGGLGSVARFIISQLTTRFWIVNSFPMGTFLVNILGCLAIGVFSGYFLRNPSDLRFLLIAGFCGGFTTFSTFSFESLQLWHQQEYIVLISYILSSVILGLFVTYLGFTLTK